MVSHIKLTTTHLRCGVPFSPGPLLSIHALHHPTAYIEFRRYAVIGSAGVWPHISSTTITTTWFACNCPALARNISPVSRATTVYKEETHIYILAFSSLGMLCIYIYMISPSRESCGIHGRAFWKPTWRNKPGGVFRMCRKVTAREKHFTGAVQSQAANSSLNVGKGRFGWRSRRFDAWTPPGLPSITHQFDRHLNWRLGLCSGFV